MRQLLASLLAAAWLASCSLMVSGISLPPADGLDAEVDAAPDQGDAALDMADAELDMADAELDMADYELDMADAELDMADAASDMADAEPDMAPDQGVPTLDPRALAGRWRIYGVFGDEGLVDQVLEVSVLGAATWERGEERLEAELVADGVRPQVSVTLGWLDAPLRGALDPRTGLGMLHGDRAVLFLSRVQIPVPEVLVDAAYFAKARFPSFGAEFGVFGELPDGAGYIEASRRSTGGELPGDVRLALTRDADRWRLSNEEEGEGRVLSPIKGRRGAIGLMNPGDEAQAGLALVWDSASATTVPQGDWLCAGLVADGEAAVARMRAASIDERGELTWASGAKAQLTATDTAVRIVAEREPFFDRDVAFALPGPEGRVMALFNRDEESGEIGYGFALCLALGLPDPIE